MTTPFSGTKHEGEHSRHPSLETGNVKGSNPNEPHNYYGSQVVIILQEKKH